MTFSPIGHEEWGPALAAKIKFSAACPMNVHGLGGIAPLCEQNSCVVLDMPIESNT